MRIALGWTPGVAARMQWHGRVHGLVVASSWPSLMHACCFLTHAHRKDDADAIYVDNDLRIQILDTMGWLPRADKEQCGAFIVSPSHPISPTIPSADVSSTVQRDERVLVVWSYNLDDIIPTARDFDDKLIKLVWARRDELTSASLSASASAFPSQSNLDSQAELTEKPEAVEEKSVKEERAKREENAEAQRERESGFHLVLIDDSDDDHGRP